LFFLIRHAVKLLTQVFARVFLEPISLKTLKKIQCSTIGSTAECRESKMADEKKSGRVHVAQAQNNVSFIYNVQYSGAAARYWD
jgi:hypothetical protein